ncbi:hypothetical protein V2J09_013759 [Rumex salicifolius]
MDLEEWEFLSEDGFIDQLHHQNRKGKRVIPRETPSLQPNTLIDSKGVSLSPNLVIHVPVEFDFQIPESFHSPPPAMKESISPGNATTPLPVFGSEPEQETVSSQVFFKKARGNEFADMKLDSPKSVNRGLVPQIDLGMPQFEEKDDGKKKVSKGSFDWNEPDQKECEDIENHGGLNIWKMGMTGIGALCSFGFACATIFVIALSTRKRENKNQNQKKLCSDEKRMKQVVHHTTKMNDAISALKGIPLNRAHITIGGYFDGV